MEMTRKCAGAQDKDRNIQAEAIPENGELRLLTLREASMRCSASRASLRRWAANPETRFPRAVRVPESQILRYWSHEIDRWLAELLRHEPRAPRSGAAEAAQRVALVIGNSAYHDPDARLRNPGNDADGMAAALGRLGFEVVLGKDLDRSGFYDKLDEFEVASRGADVTLFFYAGHGLQVEWENWLMPVDAKLEKKRDLDRRAVKLDAVMKEMGGTKKLVFLDACRNNPLARGLARSMGLSRSEVSNRGLSRVKGMPGTLVVYATEAGAVASDGDGRNSPFTEALLAHIERPELNVFAMVGEVAQSVFKATNEEQLPSIQSSPVGLGNFYLASGAAPPPPPPKVENRGEGMFVQLRTDAVEEWLARPPVGRRLDDLCRGHRAWMESRRATRPFPGGPYVLLHTLSHLLIQSLAMRCGYPASAIRERIYAEPGPDGERFGLLLYTGTPDAEGTLGGLVRQARHFEDHLADALHTGALCSNDPLCARHAPGASMERRWLHGAACHGCALIAETSCEMRNDYLDRALVVPVPGLEDAAFFRAPG